MKVLKRTDALEEFDIEKIKRSLKSASESANEPLSSSAISFIAEQVQKDIFSKHQDLVVYKDIHFRVVDILKWTGFPQIAAHYDKSELSRVNQMIQ